MKNATKNLLSKVISPAVVMLLDRMETNPEEFTKNYTIGPAYPSHKWDGVVGKETMKEVFTLLERTLIKRKLRKIRKEAVRQHIIQHIIDPEAEMLTENSLTRLARQMNESQQKCAAKVFNKAFNSAEIKTEGGRTGGRTHY